VAAVPGVSSARTSEVPPLQPGSRTRILEARGPPLSVRRNRLTLFQADNNLSRSIMPATGSGQPDRVRMPRKDCG
jgi:hypothetical protein